MRRSHHTDAEIAFLLREAEAGIAIASICAAAHVSVGTFYRWRRRLGGLPPAGIARLGRVERENATLRAEVLRLRQALRPMPASTAGPEARRSPGPGSDPRHPATVRHRDGSASVGRYAFVRTAN
ncbi:transposase [uncultured Methylobacterium sp.]|uniref:transposase n=1 Tax=uncultured Methylobacterium sp. TaxID=157278 RepID=UPI0035C9CCC8